MKKIIIFFGFLIISFLSKGQITVEVKGATSFVECGLPDTIIVKINNLSASTAKGISIDIPFQPNMVILDSIDNVVFIDTSNVNHPILGIQRDSILAGQSDSIIILVKALCGYVTGGPVNITANVTTTAGNNLHIYSGFSAYSPDITLSETGGSFVLIDRIDTMEREWVFNQIQPNAYLLDAYIQNDYYRLRIISVEYDSMGVFTTLPTSYYSNAGGKLFVHLDSTIFKFYGNQDYKLDQGEPIRIRTKFRSTFCAPTSETAGGYSCDSVTDKSMFCETSTSVFTGINIQQQNNADYALQTIVDSTSTMSTCNERSLKIRYVNRTTETFVNSGALFDLRARLMIPGIRNQIIEETKIIIDGYTIDSVEYLPVFGTAAYPEVFLGPEILSQIPGSKLTDLDGDGEFDDLAAGDTITMEFVFKKYRPSTLAEGYGGTQTTPILFTKGCNSANTVSTIGSTFFTGQEGIHIRSSNLITKVHPTLNVGDSTFYRANTIRFYGAGATNCGDSVDLKVRIRLTEGIDIVPGSYINASGAAGNHLANVITQIDSVNWDVTFRFPDPYKNGAFGFNRSLGRYHQTNINIRLAPNCTYYTQNDVCDALTGATMEFVNVLYQCETACGGGIDRDSVGGVNVLSPDGIMTVSDTNNLCAFSPGASNSITTDFVDIYRTTYGYADETYTTPFVPNTIDSVEFISGDSLVFKMNGVVRGGTYDSVRIVVDVPHFLGDPSRYFFIDWLATNIRLKEASTSLMRNCNVLDVAHSLVSGQNSYTFTFPLSCLSLDGIGNLEVGDSIFFEAIGRLPVFPPVSWHTGLTNGFLAAKFSYSNGGSFQECNSLSHFISSVGYRRLYRINNAGFISDGTCAGSYLQYMLTYHGYTQNDYRPIFNLDSVTLDMDNAGSTFVFDTTRPIMYYDRFADDFIPLPSNAVNLINSRKARLYNLGDTTLNPQDANHSGPIVGGDKFSVRAPFDVNCYYIVGNNYTSNRFTLHGDNYAYSNYLSNGPYQNTPYSTLIYRAAGGPAFINSNDNISYLFNSIQSSVVIDNVTDTFRFSIQNTSHLGATPTIGASYPYIFIDDPNGYMNVLSATDLSSNTYNVRTIPGIGHILELDTFGLNELKTIDFVFQPTSCNGQSFDFTPAWACAGYPTDSNLLGCGNIQTRTFSYTPVPANVSIQLVDDNINPNICDTLTYGVLFTNPSGGAADSLSFIYFCPDTLNITVLPATVNFKGSTYTLSSTFTPPNRYAFDLKNQVLDSTATLGFDPGDSLLFNLNIEPLCGVYVGLYNSFTITGTQACGGAFPTPAVLSSSPMNFNGTTPVYTSNIALTGSGSLNSCGSTTYNVKWYNLGGAPGYNNTTLNDSIWLILPQGMSYVNGSFSGVYNSPGNTTPTITVKPNGTFVSWGLNAGIAPGDSIEFNVGLTTLVSDTCNSIYQVGLESVRVFNLDCDGSNCPTPTLSSSDTTILTNNKAILSLQSNGGTQNGCTDSITLTVNVINTGLPVTTGTNTTVYFLADSNNNGVYDSTDVLLTSYSTTDSILTNDTLSLSYTFYPTGYTNEVCNIIALLDTSSCVCSGDTSTLIPITLTYNLNDTSVCEGDSVNLNVCAGTGYYPSRTFDWEGATSYLSDSTILSPVFRSPSNITNDTIFTFVLHTDRDSCIATDTINITVLAAPSGTLADTMICLGDSATLRSIPGMYFEVWTAAIGGTLLDTTEFKVAPLVTTTYYLTAIDSTGGCPSLTRDSVTVFIDTVAPTVICNDTTVYLNTVGQYTIDTSYILSTVSDNCGVDTVWLSNTQFNCSRLGLNTVTVYVRDGNNNLDSCTANVTVLDTLLPVITCQDTTIYLNSLGQASIDTSYVFVNATDNCGVDSIWITTSNFTCVDTGQNVLPLYARDVNNNLDSCMFTVTVLDTIKPIITCPANIVVCEGTVVNWATPVPTDNCGILNLTSNFTPGNVMPVGVHTVTYIATDLSGNVDSCSFTVTVNAEAGIADFHIAKVRDCEDTVYNTMSFMVTSGSFPVNYWFYNATDTIVMGTVLSLDSVVYFDSLSLPHGTYHMVMNNPNGCSTDSIIQINNSVDPLVVDSLFAPNYLCYLDSGSIYVRIKDGVGPYDYYLFNSLGDTVGYIQTTTDTVVVFDSLPADTYTMDVVDFGQIDWHHQMGGSQRERGVMYQDLSGNSFLIGGTESPEYSLGTPIGGIDGYLVKIDKDGHIQWRKRYGTAGVDYLLGMEEMSNGDYVLWGYKKGFFISQLYTNHDCDIWLMRIDVNGNVLYDTTYGGTVYDQPRNVKELSNGDLIIIGGSRSNNGDFTGNHGGLEDGFIMRTDGNLNLQWTRLVGSTGQDGLTTFNILPNGDILAYGWCGGNNGDVSGFHGGGLDGWIMRFDQNGNTLSQKAFGGSGYEYLNYNTVEGNYIYSLGLTNSNNGDIAFPGFGSYDGLVVRFNITADSIDKVYKVGTPQYDVLNSFVSTNDGGFFTVGEITNSSLDGWLAKFDSTGVLENSQSIGGSNGNSYYGSQYEGLSSIFKTNDGFYLVGGSYHSPNGTFAGNHGREDVLAFKLGVKYCEVINVTIPEIPQIHDTVSRIICQGDSSNIGPNYYHATGTYVDTLMSYLGCDSIVTLNLQVDSFVTETIDTMICNGQTMSVHGNNYTTQGVYIDTVINSNGCDSIHYTLNLFVDTVPPVANCIDTIVYLNTNGTVTIDSSYVSNNSSDNCSGLTITLSQSTFACTDTGVNTVTVYVRDNNNNIDSCTASVTVLDTINPIVVCNDTTIYLDATGTYTIDTSYVFANATDNCGVDSIWINTTNYTCADTGLNIVTVYVRDNNNNVDSCQAQVTVIDTIPPTVVCNDTIIYLDVTGQYTIDTSYVFVNASDNCGLDSIWITDSVFDCSRIGLNTISVYARDNNGNTESCIANVTVIDTIAPTVNCQDTTIYLSPAGTYTIDTSYVIANIMDNCTLDSVWLTPANFTCADTGLNTITIYARDVNNNIDSCTANVTVLDTVNPTISCQNATVYLDTNGQFIIDTSYVYSSAFAGCGLDSIWIVDSVFDCSRIGVNTVSVYARDINGNVDSCQAQVTVIDSINPQITCGSTLYDTVTNSCEYIVPDFRTSTLPTDNCTDSVNFQITQAPAPGTVITVQDQQIETITITVTDTNGNSTVCLFDVELTCTDEFQIPEFISPNGDGKNDTWIITGIEAYPNNNVKVFNRYGAMVYQTNGYHNQWDGTANVDYIFQSGESDNILPSGTYFFILELDVNDKNSEIYNGIIQIQK